MTNVDSSKLKEFADDNFTLHENDGKLSKMMLATSNFSISNSVFKRLVLQTRKNQGFFGKGLKIEKSFGPCQPVWTVLAKMGRYCVQIHKASSSQSAVQMFITS